MNIVRDDSYSESRSDAARRNQSMIPSGGTIPYAGMHAVWSGRLPAIVLSQRKKQDRVTKLGGERCLKDQLQVRDDLANGRAKLVCIHYAGEVTPGRLPLVSKGQEIVVLGKHHPTQLGGAGEQLLVEGVGMPIFKGRENVDAAPSQPLGDRTANVMVH